MKRDYLQRRLNIAYAKPKEGVRAADWRWSMKKYVFLLSALLCLAMSLSPAVYKDRVIDGKHFSAEIQRQGTANVIKVDVVFKGKAANIYVKPGQVLPPYLRNNQYITLYLEKETIKTPTAVTLREVRAPGVIMDNNANPDDWPTLALWTMRLQIPGSDK